MPQEQKTNLKINFWLTFINIFLVLEFVCNYLLIWALSWSNKNLSFVSNWTKMSEYLDKLFFGVLFFGTTLAFLFLSEKLATITVGYRNKNKVVTVLVIGFFAIFIGTLALTFNFLVSFLNNNYWI